MPEEVKNTVAANLSTYAWRGRLIRGLGVLLTEIAALDLTSWAAIAELSPSKAAMLLSAVFIAMTTSGSGAK